MDWHQIFVPSSSIPEIILRGTLMYLVLFTIIRVILKRTAGTVGIADLLMIVLIADAAQNGMADNYESVTEGIVLVSTLVFWNYALDWLSYRLPWFARLIEPEPLELVRNGRMLRRNMKQELLTPEELMSHLREHGVDDIKKVKCAFMEGDGQISVIERDKEGGAKGPPARSQQPL